MALIDIPSFIPDLSWIRCESKPTPCSCVLAIQNKEKEIKPGTPGERIALDELRQVIDALGRLCPTYNHQRGQKGNCELPCCKQRTVLEKRLGRN